MAKVYSLICWGGSAGNAVTVSSTTDFATLTNHGLRDGKGVAFTSGTLPTVAGTALALNTTYYAKSISTSTFELYYDSGLTSKINFTSNGSSLVLKGAFYLSLASVSRWVAVYDTLANAIAGRLNASSALNPEVFEFGESFDEYTAGALTTSGFRGASLSLTSTIDGVRTTAFHNGVLSSGYRLIVTAADGAFRANSYFITIDGLEFCYNSTGIAGTGVLASGSNGYSLVVKNCVIRGINTGQTYGVRLSAAMEIYNNIFVSLNGDLGAVSVDSGQGHGCKVYNNLVTKCGTGFNANSGAQGLFYNNISVGNTINWRGSPSAPPSRLAGNIGATTDYITFTASAGSANLITPTTSVIMPEQPIFVSSTGTLPTVSGVPLSPTTPYWIKTKSGTTITLSTSFQGATLTFDGAGTGMHSFCLVWCLVAPPSQIIDFSTPSLVFFDYTNNDFRPAGTGATPAAQAKQVESSVSVIDAPLFLDMLGNERPNYMNGGAEVNDVGPFEYDHGYGPRPTFNYRGLDFTGLVAGSTLKVFETGSTTELFSDTSTSTTETWSENVSGSRTVDYTILKDGYVPIRVTGIVVTGATSGGVLATPIQQKESRAYQTPSGLSIGTTATINTGTKRFTVTVATTVQNWFSYMQQCWRTEASLKNVAFPISENGPNSFQLSDDWQFSSGVNLLSRDGMRYVNSSGVVTDSWAAILSVGVPTGKQVRYEQTDGGTVVNAANTGNMNQLLKIYENGSFDYTGFLALKVQGDGLDQAEFDAVSTYGTLEDQLYVVGLTPTENGIAAGTVTGITITDHVASPVTWNSKAFSITITDTTGHTGEQIVQYVRGLNDFDFHDLVQTNGTEYKTVRGKLYGDTGAALKGVRVVQADGTTSHADFNLHTADDGTTYIPPLPPASVSATVLTDTRVQLFNVTTDTEIDNDFITGTSYNYVITTEASAGDTIRLRACKTGREAGEAFGIWSGTPLPLLISQPEDDVYTAWGIDGSTCTEFVCDVTGHIYIDTNDLDGVSQKVRLGAWYSWVLTLDIGIRHFYGAVSYVAVNAIRINTDIADILIENINSTTALRFTDLDVRLYRSDGTSVIAPTSYSIHNDYSGVPDVTVVTVSGTNVITGDIADIPIASENAAAVLAALSATAIPCNMVETNGEAIIGNGTESNKFRSHLVG